jgi:hypothetical protein
MLGVMILALQKCWSCACAVMQYISSEGHYRWLMIWYAGFECVGSVS